MDFILEAEFNVGVGTVDGLMATGTPAGAAQDIARVATGRAHGRIGFLAARISVALDAQGLVAFGKHLLVHRAVGLVAGGAAFLDGVMWENEGTGLGLVAFVAGFVLAAELGAHALDSIARVRVVAIAAAHLAGQHGMAVGQAELGLLVQMALEAGFCGFLGIDDGSLAAAGGDVLAAGAVAGFATHVDGILALGLEFRVVRRAEVADEFFMAGGAFLGADEGRSRD